MVAGREFSKGRRRRARLSRTRARRRYRSSYVCDPIAMPEFGCRCVVVVEPPDNAILPYATCLATKVCQTRNDTFRKDRPPLPVNYVRQMWLVSDLRIGPGASIPVRYCFFRNWYWGRQDLTFISADSQSAQGGSGLLPQSDRKLESDEAAADHEHLAPLGQ